MPLIIDTIDSAPSAQLAVGTGPLFDYYPYNEGVPNAYHWRMGDFRRTLLDLTIRPSDRAIVGVTLTLFDGHILDRMPSALENARRVVGIPVVEAINPSASVLDEHCDVSMHVGPDHVYLVVDPNCDDAVCITSNRVGFFVRERRLVGLVFGPLSPSESDALVRLLDNAGT